MLSSTAWRSWQANFPIAPWPRPEPTSGSGCGFVWPTKAAALGRVGEILPLACTNAREEYS